MSERNGEPELALWERRVAEAASAYEAEEAAFTRSKRGKPFFHWGAAVFFLLAFLLIPAVSLFLKGDRWALGDWVMHSLFWAMGIVDLSVSVYLFRWDARSTGRLRLMNGFCDKLDELRREFVCTDTGSGPLQAFRGACEDARWERIRRRIVYSDEILFRKDALPVFAVLLLAVLAPVIAAGVMGGGWDPFQWVSSLMLTAAAGTITGLELFMLALYRLERKELRVTGDYLEAVKRAHDTFRRSGETGRSEA